MAATTPSHADIARQFRLFAEREACGVSPIYRHLAEQVAGDEAILALAARTRPDQPRPNILFAAVQDLLQRDPGNDLAMLYYAEPFATARPTLWPAFRAFCLANEEAIAGLLAQRIIQTNEARRSSCLAPAFLWLHRFAGNRPLALYEIGASAGLNLLWDQYHHVYDNGQEAGDRHSPVVLDCAVKSSRPLPVDAPLPPVWFRRGVDISPVRPDDTDGKAWLRALIWPEQTERRRILDAALDLAEDADPELIAGDGVALLPDAVRDAPAESALCVLHCFTVNQFPPDLRDRFDAVLMHSSHARTIYRLAMEYDGQPRPRLTLTVYDHGRSGTEVLAVCDAHGAWIAWLAENT